MSVAVPPRTRPPRRLRAAPLVLALLPAACGGGHGAGAPAPSADACPDRAYHAELPEWARGGFSPGAPSPPNVIGRRGRIAAVIFGWPLASPPAKDRANKVLWVPRVVPVGGPVLRITARRVAGGLPTGPPVRRLIASGPGPSYVNLPAKGCWRLRLSWGAERDTLDLPYS